VSINRELQLERPMRDVYHEAVLNIVRTANVLSQKGAVLFRQYDLTEAQFNVLFALKYKDSKWTQSDLGKRLVVTRASVTSVLDKLQDKGLIERIAVPGNRRIYHVELTDEGREAIDKVEPAYRKDVHGVLSDLDDDRCRALIQTLEQIRERVAALENG